MHQKHVGGGPRSLVGLAEGHLVQRSQHQRVQVGNLGGLVAELLEGFVGDLQQVEGLPKREVAEVAPALGAEENLGDFHHTSGTRKLVGLSGEFSAGGISKLMTMTLPRGGKANP